MLAFQPHFPAVSGGAIAIEQRVDDAASSHNTASYETTSITIGAAANRVLIAQIAIVTAANTTDISGTTVTFGAAARTLGDGTAMTIIGSHGLGGADRRLRLITAALVAPAGGAGTVQVHYKNAATANSAVAGNVLTLYELSGADQTAGNYQFASTGGAGGATTKSTTFTPYAAGALALSQISILSGDFASELSAIDGATLDGARASGTTAASDLTAGFSREECPTTAANGNGFAWTTSAESAVATAVIGPA